MSNMMMNECLESGHVVGVVAGAVDEKLVTRFVQSLPPDDAREISESQEVVLDAYRAVRAECAHRGFRVDGLADAAARRLHLLGYRDASGRRYWSPLARLPFAQPAVAAALVRTRLRWRWNSRESRRD